MLEIEHFFRVPILFRRIPALLEEIIPRGSYMGEPRFCRMVDDDLKSTNIRGGQEGACVLDDNSEVVNKP